MKSFIEIIKEKIVNNIQVNKIEIIDNTHIHKKHKSFHAEKRYLYLEIESKFLRSLSRLEAQRNIMKILKDELKNNIHALEIKIK